MTFKALAVSGIALFCSGAQANSSLGQLNLIDMTAATGLSGDMVLTKGFLHDIDLVAFEQPRLSVAYTQTSPDEGDGSASGWAGIVEVDTNEEPSLSLQDSSAFSDKFTQSDRETRMSGFYTMRYQFETDLPFRPYAGAGLGLVTSNSSDAIGGIVAGRATAGFDLTVGADSALFAEYALVKSGGVNLGTTRSDAFSEGSLPDIEHSLKIGFRRTF